jgi:hypothetical protein
MLNRLFGLPGQVLYEQSPHWGLITLNKKVASSEVMLRSSCRCWHAAASDHVRNRIITPNKRT